MLKQPLLTKLSYLNEIFAFHCKLQEERMREQYPRMKESHLYKGHNYSIMNSEGTKYRSKIGIRYISHVLNRTKKDTINAIKPNFFSISLSMYLL